MVMVMMMMMMSPPVVASTPNSDQMALLAWISAKTVQREPDNHSVTLESVFLFLYNASFKDNHVT
jgi:hypothetical protein